MELFGEPVYYFEILIQEADRSLPVKSSVLKRCLSMFLPLLFALLLDEAKETQTGSSQGVKSAKV